MSLLRTFLIISAVVLSAVGLASCGQDNDDDSIEQDQAERMIEALEAISDADDVKIDHLCRALDEAGYDSYDDPIVVEACR